MRVRLGENNEPVNQNNINPYDLDNNQCGILLRIKLSRRLAGDELGLAPVIIDGVKRAMINFDGSPYIEILTNPKPPLSLINLLIEDISCRLYLEQITNYKRNYIESAVYSIIKGE